MIDTVSLTYANFCYVATVTIFLKVSYTKIGTKGGSNFD